MDQATREFKISLVGDGGVGKTALTRRHLTGEFIKRYVPTIGVEVHPIAFHTTVGRVLFKVWDCAGQEKFGGLRDGYYISSHGGIIMFDVTSRLTYQNVPNWHRDLCRVCGQIPIVLCGNKVDFMSLEQQKKQWAERKAQREKDLQEAKKSGTELEPIPELDDHTECPARTGRLVSPKMITFHRKRNLSYYDISVKSNYNIEKPFLSLIRQLAHDDTIEFCEAVTLRAPEVRLTQDQINQLEREQMLLENVHLPDDDESNNSSPPSSLFGNSSNSSQSSSLFGNSSTSSQSSSLFGNSSNSSQVSSLFGSSSNSSNSSQSSSQVPKMEAKVLLVGDGGVGKTALVSQKRDGVFQEKYLPTLGVEVTPLSFQTNRGEFNLKLWDCAGLLFLLSFFFGKTIEIEWL